MATRRLAPPEVQRKSSACSVESAARTHFWGCTVVKGEQVSRVATVEAFDLLAIQTVHDGKIAPVDFVR
jgi:hypothetical protein